MLMGHIFGLKKQNFLPGNSVEDVGLTGEKHAELRYQ
jgi:hypothetical protein